MSIVAEKTTLTFEAFLARPDHHFFELVDGDLVEVHVSLLSSHVALALGSRLIEYCRRTNAGKAFGCDLYYRCFPDHPQTGRRPDVSFIRQENLPSDWQMLGFSTIAPDLAVEVISPNDLAGEVDDKLSDYQDAGVPLIWVIHPENRFVMVYRGDGTVARLREKDEIDGENILPGFKCPVADLFPKGI